MFDGSQSVKTWSQLGLFLVFCFFVCLFGFGFFPKASTSKGSHFIWVLFWLVLFLTQKHYSHLNLLPSVLVSEVTALET